MSNFLKSLFGAKKAAKFTKSKMQTRRLELIGLEERITPAATLAFGSAVLSLTATSAEALTVSASGQVLTFTATGAITATGIAGATGTGTSTVTVDLSNVAYAGSLLNLISLNGAAGAVNSTLTVNGALDLTAVTGTTSIGLSLLDDGTGDNDAFINFGVKTKGAGGVTVDVNNSGSLITIAALGDITTTTGAVAIGTTASVISTAGDVTTTSGAIGYTGAVTLVGGNVATTSTLAGGNLSITGALALGANNFTANQGLGNVNAFTGAVTGTGALSLTGAAVTVGTITSAGAVSATATTGDLTFGLITTAASVNAKSTAGDVVFGSTVNTSAVGGFVSEATLATKATKIADAVTVGAGANATVNGNLVTTANFSAGPPTVNPSINTTSGAILVTGKIDASTAGFDLALATTSGGNITVNGAIGSSPTFAMGDLILDTSGTILVSSTVIAADIEVGTNVVPSTSSVTFSDAVKSTGANGLGVTTLGNGTISFAKTIEVTNAAASIDIGSVNGLITVTGNITGKDSVSITTSGSGAITISGAISTDAADGDILIESTSGNVVTSGAISTTGATADIIIDTATSGNITIGGNVSTSGGGDIILGADSTSLVSGTGNLTINGTVTTTGTAAGDIAFGIAGGTGAINKAVTAGATGDVIFINSLATDAYTIVSGANISAGDNVLDAIISGGAFGIINLGANVTALNGSATSTLGINGIGLDNSINLTGAVSMKAAGTGGDISLASVDGFQNLTLETPAVSGSNITLFSVGATTALNTLTITNSGGFLSAGNFNASVVVTDTTGSVQFNGASTVISQLTTAAKAYSMSFGVISSDTTVIYGAPVFLNTGNVSFAGNTTLISGATITGAATTNVSLSGNITTAIGDINIGALPVTTIANGTNIIFNGSGIDQVGTFAGVVNMVIGDELYLTNGELVLSGDSSAAFLGDIYLYDATVNVTGKIGSASNIFGNLGLITGPGGTIGNVVAQTITIVDPQGTLNTGTVTLNAASTYIADVLTTTTASNLTGNAGFSLGGANLFVETVASGLAVGNSFTIINNTAVSGGLTGQFFAQPEGSSISAFDASGNIVTFTVSYIGGTNANDVTLTVASVTPQTPTPAATPQPMVAGQPALNKFTAVGADAGAGPLVTITFQNGTFVSFFAYAPAFTGGVRVALGDVNGDGSTDVITGAGSNGGPQVNVFNVDNTTGAVSLQTSFFAFDEPFFAGGVYVAAADTNDDGFDDVVVGAGAGGGPRVQVYAGSATGLVTSSTLNDFFAYSLDFAGGVVVAAGDRNADGDSEVITAPASNGGFNIKSFDVNGNGNSPTLVDNFFAFNDTTSVGGLSLAVGFFDFTNIADLVVGTTNSAFGVFLDSDTSGIATVPFAGFTGAIRAGVAEDSFGQEYAVALAGPTGGPRISVFSVGATSLTETDNLFVMNPAFTGGLFGTSTLGD